MNPVGEHGYTPIHEAVLFGHFDAVKLLIELGAKPLRVDDGWLPSEIAEEGGELTAWLKERGY